MNLPTFFISGLSQRLRRRWTRCGSWVSGHDRSSLAWTKLESWAPAHRQPVWVGVSQHDGSWHVVLNEYSERQLLKEGGADPSPTRLAPALPNALQHRGLSGLAMPEGFWVAERAAREPLDGAAWTAWRSALKAVITLLPPGPCHLVVSWPDEALGAAAITLTGPFTMAELPSVMEQEISAVLPGPMGQTAWDARWPATLKRPAGAGLGSIWDGLRNALSALVETRDARVPDAWDRDISLQYWSIPAIWARQLQVLGRELGLASLTLEPSSVSLERAESWSLSWAVDSAAPPWATSSEGLAALGASCRRGRHDPNLLRQHRAYLDGWRVSAARWCPWLLGWCLALGGGYVAGGPQVGRWTQERQGWELRFRQVQAHQQAIEQRQQALVHAHRLQQLHVEHMSHNQRFGQWLEGWAATVPDGLRWQHVSVRPQRIELQAQALDVERLSRWVERWPDTLPSGSRPQIHWQPTPVGVAPVSAVATLDLSVQLSWGSAGDGRE